MRILGQTAIALGVAAGAVAAAVAPIAAGPMPTSVAALTSANPTDTVQVRWIWRDRGFAAAPLAAGGVRLDPYRYECGYYPCPVYEPAYIPYGYYGAPKYRGFYRWWYNRHYWCAYGCDW